MVEVAYTGQKEKDESKLVQFWDVKAEDRASLQNITVIKIIMDDHKDKNEKKETSVKGKIVDVTSFSLIERFDKVE